MSERKLENLSEEPLGSVDVMEIITTRAYEMFQARGGEHGRDLDDWLQAEQEILASLSETEAIKAQEAITTRTPEATPKSEAAPRKR